MHLTCPDCGAVVPAADINIDQGIAKCRACDGVIDVAEAMGKEGGPRPLAKRPRLPQPRAIIVEDLGGGLRLTRSWFTWAVIVMTLFCVAWDSFLVFWYSMALAGNAPWIAIVFPVLHLALGVALTYGTLAMYLNRTVLEVAQGRLTVRHGPLPWPGRRDLDAGDLEQLYCDETASRGRRGSGSYSYNVWAVLKDGQRVKLLDTLPNREQALFVEQMVEDYLGIEDRPVHGELPRW
jgi:hypothetical protein